MKLVLDAGALVAIERLDRETENLLRVAHSNRIGVATSAGAVAQVWHNGARQANLARALDGVASTPIDDGTARRLGPLLRASRTTDIVDAHVALIAAPGDRVLTSDPGDIARLLAVRKVKAVVTRV
jgi:hypothetical protein